MKKYSFHLFISTKIIAFRLAIIIAISIFSIQFGSSQIVNLPCQTEDVAVEDLERKDFETPSGSTAIHSEGSMHNFTLPLASDFDPCKIISNITIEINAIGVDLSNLPPDCAPTPLPYYYNIALGCPDFTPASCNTANLLGEPNTPTFTNQNFSYNGDFDFGENLSVDIVPVMNINCTLGQQALTMNTVVLDYEICVSVTVSDAPSTVDVEFIPDNINVCPNETTTIDAGFFVDADYLWDPNGETTQMITVGQGTYTVTVTDANGCTDSDEITITPFADSDINFDPVAPSVCDDGFTNVSVNETYNTYAWSNGLFGQSVSLSTGMYDVTITDNNNCTAVEMIEVTNTPPPNAGIDNFLDVCNDGTTYDIEALLLTFDTGGTWNDNDFSGIDINTSPNSVSFTNTPEATYTYTYTVAGNAPCPADDATITIQVFDQNFAGVTDIVQYCSDPGILDFYFLIGNPDIGGTWTDNGPTGVDLSDPFAVNLNGVPAGSYDFDYLLTANGVCAAQSATLTVVILEAAFAGNDNSATVCEGTIFNLNDLIDGANTTGFFEDTDVSGVLTGSSVNTTGLAGQSFNYTFTVGSSSSPCGMDDAIFTINIESSVSAGDNNSESLCIGGNLNLVDYLINEDAGGSFIDLDASGGLAGNILNTNNITAGTYTYQYEIGDGITCPKDSSQIELTFISRPMIDIVEEEISICESQCQDIAFNLTGTPPFSFPIEIYSLDGILIANDTINTSTNSYNLITCNLNDTIGFANDTLSLLTDSAWILTIPSLMDDMCSYTFSNDADTLDIFTYSNSIYSLDTTACITDTVLLNGREFYLGNETYQDTIPGSRCDSIIDITVVFQSADTVYISPILCLGESTEIGGVSYGEINPYVEINFTNPDGCDSLTIIEVSFHPISDTLLMIDVCAGEIINLNGTPYSDTNLTGSDTLINQSSTGCDSIVNVQVTVTTGITIDRNDILCEDEILVIEGVTFDFTNQSDQIILSGTGCDTTINVDLTFIETAEGNENGIYCPDYSITINGTPYNISNPIGVEPIASGSVAGCDSVLNINLSFYPVIENSYTADICGDDFIEINGTIYDQNNLSDIEVFEGVGSNGCDSTVNVFLTWAPEYNESISTSICEGDSILLDGQYQFVSGTYQDTFQTIAQCDSIISTTVTFISCQVEVSITATNNDCAGDSIGGFSIDIISTIEIPYTISWVGQTNGISDELIIDSQQNIVNITNLSSDTYTISIIDNDGTVIYQETIEIMDINPELNGNWVELESILCFDSLGSIEFIATGGLPTYNYTWSQSDIGNTATGENLTAGDYSLTITDQNGCTTETSYSLVNPDEILFSITSMDLSCEGINDGQIAISNIIGGQAPYIISIDDSILVDMVLGGLEAGVYEIIIEDGNGCVKTMTEEILDDGNMDFASYEMEYTITVGDSVNLIGTITEDSLTFAWTNGNSLSCNDCATPSAMPSSSTSYNLTITNLQGCSQIINILVNVENVEPVFEVGNIFSPNGDNVNDELIFDYGPGNTLAVEIFDRWGNRVFQEELIDGVISWDGFYNGNILANGVYVYNVQVTDSEGNTESKFGDVMILR
jgi:gliding motility-associated-like protein